MWAVTALKSLTGEHISNSSCHFTNEFPTLKLDFFCSSVLIKPTGDCDLNVKLVKDILVFMIMMVLQMTTDPLHTTQWGEEISRRSSGCCDMWCFNDGFRNKPEDKKYFYLHYSDICSPLYPGTNPAPTFEQKQTLKEQNNVASQTMFKLSCFSHTFLFETILPGWYQHYMQIYFLHSIVQ